MQLFMENHSIIESSLISSSKPGKADIVIVNWNSGQQLQECLTSIAEHGGDNVASITVVDNDSQDGSCDKLEEQDLPLTVIRNTENLGFGRACNIGTKVGNAPYVLFLNPDAKLMRGALSAAIAWMESADSKGFGICGIRLLDEHGNTQRQSARFPSPRTYLSGAIGLNALFPSVFPTVHMHEFDHLESRAVDHVIGAFYLVRRSLFDLLGGFDERFFVYLEDLDFSLRAKHAGWNTWYLAEATAFHKGGGTSEQVKAHRLFYSLHSRLLYAFKHFSSIEAWGVLIVSVAVEPIPRIFRALMRRSWEELQDTMRGYFMLWRSLPDLIKKARHSKVR